MSFLQYGSSEDYLKGGALGLVGVFLRDVQEMGTISGDVINATLSRNTMGLASGAFAGAAAYLYFTGSADLQRYAISMAAGYLGNMAYNRFLK